MMRKLKKVNVPNTMQHQSQSNEYRVINKKKIRRFLLALLFIVSSTLYVQYILTKQQEMIQKKRVIVEKQQKQLVYLKKDSEYLEAKVENLTNNEEEILQFARKEYHFSKPDETIFILTE
ncbi:Septum formation initiator [Bacillus cytotoxicus NVH 391-98]|uniref:Septum formation initiator n=2 Tax=Bacillus TaxID=1386 RepID=A7GQ15_BACCN|nr:Septum formation initiator [Bacillus cytotoxicus NVH 391-98]